MATRKEEKERRREERLAAERREADQARRRLILGYVAAGILTAAVVVGIVVAVIGGGGGDDSSGGGDSECSEAHIAGGLQFGGGETFDVPPDCREGTPPPELAQASLAKAAKAANCDLRLDLPDEGNQHVESQTVKYDTDPPTSGDHNPIPQADGAYSEMPDAVNFVHTLEHGRVEIQYSPDLPEEDQLAIKGVFDESPGGLLLFPNDQMPYEVAAAAWTQLVGCKTYEGPATLDTIRDFITQYRGRGPEGVPFPSD